MSTVIRIPIDLRTPEQTGIAGNSYWTVQSGGASQFGHWAFKGDVTGAIVYGFVQVPSNVDPNSTGVFVLNMGASATSAALSAWRVCYSEILTGERFDVTAAAWNNIDATGWTAPATNWASHDMTFDTTGTLTANAIVAIKIDRDADGTSATDNCTAVVGLFDAFLQITATA